MSTTYYLKMGTTNKGAKPKAVFRLPIRKLRTKMYSCAFNLYILLVLQIVVFLFCIAIVCVIGCGIWNTIQGNDFQVYLPWYDFIPGTRTGETGGTAAAGSTVIALLVFFSYLILFNTVVPISLYVRSVTNIRDRYSKKHQKLPIYGNLLHLSIADLQMSSRLSRKCGSGH